MSAKREQHFETDDAEREEGDRDRERRHKIARMDDDDDQSALTVSSSSSFSSSSSSSESSSSGSDSETDEDDQDVLGVPANGGKEESSNYEFNRPVDDDQEFGMISNSSLHELDDGYCAFNAPEVDAETELVTAAAEASARQQQQQKQRFFNEGRASLSPLSTLVNSITGGDCPPLPPSPLIEQDEEVHPPLPGEEEPSSSTTKPPEPAAKTGEDFNEEAEEQKQKGVFEDFNDDDGDVKGGWESEDDDESEELFAMLESDVKDTLEEQQQEKAASNGIRHYELTRRYLVEKGKNHFDVLPRGWVKIRHSSGMPVYLHRDTRVASLSRPYALGRLSSRQHSIPLGSIPCLDYKRATEEEEEATRDVTAAAEQQTSFPKAKISTLAETRQAKSVTPNQLKAYCQRLFEIREVKMKKFPTWKEKRIYQKERTEKMNMEHIAKVKSLEKSHLPDGLKLITIPVIEMEKHNENLKDDVFNRKIAKKSKKDWVLNPKGKSSVCILHEYLQQSIKKPPEYRYSEIDSPSTPYSATVLIDGVEYGKGVGQSKKHAKSESARLTLEILIPEFKNTLSREISRNAANKLNELPDVSFFDSLRIQDPRVSDLCQRVGEPSPFAILNTCLKRNFGQGDTNVETNLVPKRNKRNEFFLKVNNREVSVICKNKRDGKQLAAQKLLQLLHPQLKSWSSLLKMYGSRSITAQKLKKEKESEVTALQSKNSDHSSLAPSQAILEKLRAEMKKLAENKRLRQPSDLVGKLTVSASCATIQTHLSSSASRCLNKIDL